MSRALTTSPSEPVSSSYPTSSSSFNNVRNTPCSACRASRGRCIWFEGSSTCGRCTSKGMNCSGPHRVKAMKCALCYAHKVRCDWLETIDNVCARCHRLGKDCPGARPTVVLEYADEHADTAVALPKKAITTANSSIGPSSKSSKLFNAQLAHSLAWHCIELSCASGHISFGGGDPELYMDYFQKTRRPSSLSHSPALFEEVLTSLVIFTGATLSNHSAIVGQNAGPTFQSLFEGSTPTLHTANSFPVLAPQRSIALESLSSTVADHTSHFLQAENPNFQDALRQLGLVRLVLSKATAVGALWQYRLCELATLKGLSMLRDCSSSERDQLIPILRNFAFKGIINAASDDLNVSLFLSQSDFDLIFDPPSLLLPITSQDVSTYIYSPISHSAFLQFVWFGMSRGLYGLLARTFFDLVQPSSKSTLSTIWSAIDSFRAYKFAFFETLWSDPKSGSEDETVKKRQSVVVRTLLAYEANYYKMAMVARTWVKSSEEEKEKVAHRWPEIVAGIAEDVAMIISLHTIPTRKLEVLIHHICLLLKVPTDELASDFSLLSLPMRLALLQGIRSFALMVKGPTAAHLDALIVLLHATDPTHTSAGESQDSVPAIHVACALLDMVKPLPADAQVTSLFVLVA